MSLRLLLVAGCLVLPILSVAAAAAMRQTLTPKCRSNSVSSVAMIACFRSGLMSSYPTTTRRWVANSPITWLLAEYTRVMVLGV